MTPFSNITEPAIAALVDRFYAKARRDPLIGPVFNNAVDDWDEHLHKLNDFWSSVERIAESLKLALFYRPAAIRIVDGAAP